MATILVEIDKRALQGGKQCCCRPQQPTQTKQPTQTHPTQTHPTQAKQQPSPPAQQPAAARVMGAKAAAATPPQTATTPSAEEKKNEWSLSYASWLALLSVGVGIVIISQTKK